MPDELFVPSPWLPGTEEAGPLGQLAAIIPAYRGGWTGEEMGLVGISATTGEYRFLDLPDLHAAPGAVLSPDGRHVAYWATGETNGSPGGNGGPVSAVAVYDAVSGQVARHEVATEHGLRIQDLVWTDLATLLVVYGQYAGGEDDGAVYTNAVRPEPWQVLTLGEGLRTLRPPVRADRVAGAGGGAILLDRGGVAQVVVDLAGTVARTRFRLERWWQGELRLSPDRSRLAGIPGDWTPGPIGVAEMRGSGSRARLAPIPGEMTAVEIVTWTDEEHLVVLSDRDPERGSTELVEVEVATGDARSLVTLDPDLTSAPQFALDLLGGPIVEAVEPPDPVDPRAVVALSGGAVLATAAGIVVWRRRVQP